MLQAQRCPGAQMLSVLKRLGKRRRHAWPDTLLILRGDSPVAYPEGRPGVEAPPGRSSVTGWTSQAVLKDLARAVVAPATRA
jgi:hypothetical protein